MAIDISMNVPLVNIIGQWFKNYHGKKYDSESEAAVSRNNASIRAENINTDNIPNEAKKAIDIAVYIAGSDLKAKSNKPQSPIELKNNSSILRSSLTLGSKTASSAALRGCSILAQGLT